MIGYFDKVRDNFSDESIINELKILLDRSRKGSDAHRENIKFIMTLINFSSLPLLGDSNENLLDKVKGNVSLFSDKSGLISVNSKSESVNSKNLPRFNRTIVELRKSIVDDKVVKNSGFNRTIVELRIRM